MTSEGRKRALQPASGACPDLAASYARRLLEGFGLDLSVADREQTLSAPVEWARSGAMWLTGPAGGAPQFAAGALAASAQGVGIALQTLAPSTQLENLDAPALLGERAAIAGLQRNGRVSAGGSAQLLRARSGGLVVNLPRDDDWHLAPAWLEASDSTLAATRDWKALAREVAKRDRATLVERGRLMGLAVAPVVKGITPNGPLIKLDIATETRPIDATERPVRLLDLSTLWSGPLATSLLAMAGVEVLKIESPRRPDGARQGPDAFFQLLNDNKQGCALDLTESADRGVFDRLLARADIVVESARPRGLAQLGFDAASWVAARPGRIWASITGYGRDHEWIAFGDDAAVAAGLAWPPEASIDSSEPGPYFCGDAIADPLTGLHLAALVLAHLRSGRGGLLDLSLMDCASHAASLPTDRLVLPVEREADGWCVVEDGARYGIERPRGRRPRGRAPALSAPTESLIAKWTAAC